jgi:solute carrier family 25 folate transporter 32
MRAVTQHCIVGSCPTWSETPLVGPSTFSGEFCRDSVQWSPSHSGQTRYGNIKDLIKTARGNPDVLTSYDYFLASGASGILTALCTNPIWVIKTRMLSTSRDAPGAYKSIRQGTTHLWKTEGLKGFYRGLIPSLFGVSHGAIQFMAYEQLKNHWSTSRGGRDNLTNLDFLLLSAVSKMFAGSATYPYQVVRARLQTYDADSRYNGVRDVVKQVFRKEGLKGFYKGYVLHSARLCVND